MGTSSGLYKTIPVYKKTKGLNNFSDPTRLVYDLDNGVLDLAVAYNVDIDPAGRISRRRFGSSLLQAWNVKNLFCDKGDCLFTADDNLYQLGAGLDKRILIRSNLTPSARMWYKQTPTGAIYYANGFERGIVKNGISLSWNVTPYVGPQTTIVYSDPPDGLTMLELYHGRMYGVVRNVLWYSERYAWNWFNLAAGFISFDSDITMLHAAFGSTGAESEGLYVGTEKGGVIWLEGNQPTEFQFRRVHQDTPVKGTCVSVDSDDVGNGKIFSGQGCMWIGGGIWAGGTGGNATNLTKGRLVLPSSLGGTACLSNGKYIALIQ